MLPVASTASEHWGDELFLSLALPVSPLFSPFPLPIPSFPLPSWGPNPLIRLVGLGERSSPAARRFLVHFRLKRTLLVITIIKEVSYQSTGELSRQRLFHWQY